jgi:hypothetical protein
MGNSTKKQTNELAASNVGQTNKEFDPYNSAAKSAYDTQSKDAASQVPGLRSRYEDWAGTGGFDAGSFDNLRKNTGGQAHVDPLDESRFTGALAGYQDFAGSGGGVDAEGIRTRSNRAIPQFYQNLKNQMETRRKVNPYAPSFDAEQAAMARQSGQQTQENIRDTETGINEMVRQGRMFGIGGLANLNTNIAGMQNQRDLANASFADSAMGRKANSELAIQQMIQEGKLKGLGGLQGLYETSNNNANEAIRNWLAGISSRSNNVSGAVSTRNNQGIDWAKWAQIAGTTAAGAAMASDINLKYDIEKVNDISVKDKLRNLDIFTWKYKGDDTRHIGPMAQDMQKIFGVGDGKTIHLVDVMGIAMLLMKEIAEAN